MPEPTVLVQRQKTPFLLRLHAALKPSQYKYGSSILLGWTEHPAILHLTQLQGEDPYLDVEVAEEDDGQIGLYVIAGYDSDKPYTIFTEFGWNQNVLKHYADWLYENRCKQLPVCTVLAVMETTLTALIHPPAPTAQVIPFKR